MKFLRGKMKFSYDKTNDVLYAYINKPRPATCIELGGGMLIRVCPKTEKIVGFTWIGANRRIQDACK